MAQSTSTGGTVLSLLDWAKRVDPDGDVPVIAEMLNQKNDILTDILWKEGNLPTGNRNTLRTGLPSATWRIANTGVNPSKSTTQQADESAGILELWGEIDQHVADLNGISSQIRMSEAGPCIEAMNQQFSQTLIYGNTYVNPERFLGFAPRFASISGAINAQNIMNANGGGATNCSVWLVVWGADTVYGIFPKGSKAGLFHEDLGLQIVQTATGIGTGRMRAYVDQYVWKCGLNVKDWRYVVRVANISVPDLTGGTATQNAQQLIKLMMRAMARVPSWNAGKPVFYMNRTAYSILGIQALDKSQNALGVMDSGSQFGTLVKGGMSFFGIPIRICDQLLNTESAIS